VDYREVYVSWSIEEKVRWIIEKYRLAGV